MREGRHPRDNDLYALITPRILETLDEMRRVHSTWRDVSAVSGKKLKVIRRLRQGGGDRKTVSLTFWDDLVTTTGVGTVDEHIWFTPADLIALGVWRDPGHWYGSKKKREKD